MRTQLPFTLLATALACSLGTAPAQARARVFVASYGNDANPCTFGSPCKTFQHAHNVVDPDGEVTAIDGAGFGPINITKAVTITSPDGVEAGIVPAAGGNAINIDAGPTDAVVLRGLTLNGSGIAYNGVVFNSGGSLTITNCVVQNFVNNGNNTGNGLLIQSAGAVVLDHVVTNHNQSGIAVSGTPVVTISNSIASNNSTFGIALNGGVISIDNVSISGNATGIAATGDLGVVLSRSVIMGNSTAGILNNTAPVPRFLPIATAGSWTTSPACTLP